MIKAEVEGVKWNLDAVAKSRTESSFVRIHLNDAGTYSHLDSERKETALKLVYSLAVPKKVAPPPTTTEEG
jgi:hypothetical protein